MVVIKTRQSQNWVLKILKFRAIFLIPLAVCIILSASLVTPIGIQRAITENYFSQVKLIRQSIFTIIGQAYTSAKNPSLNTEKLRLNIKEKHLYAIEGDRKLAVSRGGGGGLDFSYGPASIDHAEGTGRAKVRLKGDNLEQFASKRLSFRIRMRDDKGSKE